MTDFYDYYNDKYDYLAVMRPDGYRSMETAGRRPGYLKSYGEGRYDAFATLNPVKPFNNGKYRAYSRRQGNIAALKFCYVDIDYKEFYPAGLAPKPERMLALLYNEGIIPNLIPKPTGVIFSGTGFWLLYALRSSSEGESRPENIKALPRWKEVQRRLHHILKDYGADPKVTEDYARVCRIIGSKNPKNGKTVTYMSLAGKEYTLYELLEYIPETPNEKPEKKNNKVKCDPDKKFFGLRANDLAYILRNHRDFEGSREIILWMYRATLLSAGLSDNKALEETLKLNSSLDNPLSDREVISHTKSAQRHKYKFSNEKIIKMLGLDSSELNGLITIKTKAAKRQTKQRNNRRNYEKRVKAAGKMLNDDRMQYIERRIISMIKAGKAVTHICKRLGISKSTFYVYKKRIGEITVNKRSGMHRVSSQNLVNTERIRSPENSATILKGRSPVIGTDIKQTPVVGKSGTENPGPGEVYQMDWGFVEVENENGVKYKIACLAMICHSCGKCYIEFFPNTRQENLFIGMIHAFMHLGIPETVVSDSMKSVVIGRDSEGHPVWQKDYELFMGNIGFNTKLCKPRHPFTKGIVERPICFVKDNFLADRVFTELTDLNYEANDWCKRQNAVYHMAEDCVPDDRHSTLCMQRAYKLKNTKELAYYLCPERKISFAGFVNYEGRRFGVPYWYTEKTCRVMRDGYELKIYDTQMTKVLAVHNVTWSRRDSYCKDQFVVT